MEEVPRHTSLVPLAFPCFLHCLIGVETEGLLDYQGRAGYHFHCMVEPSPGHIRCRNLWIHQKTPQPSRQISLQRTESCHRRAFASLQAEQKARMSGKTRESCVCVRASGRISLVTRITATSQSQIASDCNRNSKKSLRLRKHPLKPTLWTRESPVLCGFYSVSEAPHGSGNPPEYVATIRV